MNILQVSLLYFSLFITYFVDAAQMRDAEGESIYNNVAIRTTTSKNNDLESQLFYDKGTENEDESFVTKSEDIAIQSSFVTKSDDIETQSSFGTKSEDIAIQSSFVTKSDDIETQSSFVTKSEDIAIQSSFVTKSEDIAIQSSFVTKSDDIAIQSSFVTKSDDIEIQSSFVTKSDDIETKPTNRVNIISNATKEKDVETKLNTKNGSSSSKTSLGSNILTKETSGVRISHNKFLFQRSSLSKFDNPINTSFIENYVRTDKYITDGNEIRIKRDAVSNKFPAGGSDTSSSAVPMDDFEDYATSYQNAAARLQKFILRKHNAVHNLPPYNVINADLDNTSGIFLKFTPFRILSVDEVQQSVSVSCYIVIKWYDSSLTWDPALYGNINQTSIKSARLWTPTIVLPTSTGHGLYLGTTEYLLITQKKLPFITMKIPFQFTVQCDLDLSRYPFDQQSCVIIFTELSERILSAMNTKETDFEMAKALHTSGEWEIVEWHHLERLENEPYSLRWIIKIRRQSTFYVANLLIPLVQTATMSLLVFWIPAESGEKMSYLVSMFVSTSVFLFIINDEMPRSISSLPTINLVVVGVNSEIILVSIASLAVLRRYRWFKNIKDNNISLKSTTKLTKETIKLDENDKVSESPSGNKSSASLSQRVRPILHAINPFQSSAEIQTKTFSAENNESIALTEESGKLTKTIYKFGFPEVDQQQQAKHLECSWNSHNSLDMIFFCFFATMNLFGAIYAYIMWF